MHLFLDVDGVLLNFERSFVHFLNREQGLNLPDDYETTSWYFEDILPAQAAMQAWDAYMASEEAARMPPLVEPAAFNAVAGRHQVHLLTNFPAVHMPKRESNLRALGFAYGSLHHCGLHNLDGFQPRTKAAVIGEIRRADEEALFVDDHPDNCVDVAEHCPGVEVWLMSRRFNQGFDHPRIARAHDWRPIFARLGR